MLIFVRAEMKDGAETECAAIECIVEHARVGAAFETTDGEKDGGDEGDQANDRAGDNSCNGGAGEGAGGGHGFEFFGQGRVVAGWDVDRCLLCCWRAKLVGALFDDCRFLHFFPDCTSYRLAVDGFYNKGWAR